MILKNVDKVISVAIDYIYSLGNISCFTDSNLCSNNNISEAYIIKNNNLTKYKYYLYGFNSFNFIKYKLMYINMKNNMPV